MVRADRRAWHTVDRSELRPDGLAGISSLADGERAAVAIALPVKESFTQWVEAPFASLAKARRIFDSLLDLKIPFAVESCSREFLQVGRNSANGNVEALAVGAGLDQIEAALERARGLGLDPEIIDHEGLALWDQAALEYPSTKETVRRIVIYVGADRLVVVRGRDRRFELARSSAVDIGESGQIDPQQSERIARRLARIVQMSADDGELDLIWSGPRAADESVRTAIATALALGKDALQVVADNPETFLARALARRARGKVADGVNLRGGALLHADIHRSIQRKKCRLAATALTAGLLLCCANIVWVALLARHHDRIQEHLQSAARAISGLEYVQRGMELESVQSALEQRRPAAERLRGLFEASAGSRSILIAEFAIGNGIRIDRLDFRNRQLEVVGLASDWNACRRFADYVATLGYEVDLNRREAGADERVHFSMDGERNEV